MSSLAASSSAVFLIVCGAVNALLSKIVYQLEAPDCSGTVKPFEKPWLQTALMFVAMALCLPIAWVQDRWSAARRRKQQQQQHTRKQHAAHTSSSPFGGNRSSSSTDVEAQDPAFATAAVVKAATISALAAASTASSTASGGGGQAAAAMAEAPHGLSGSGGGGGDANNLRQPLLASQHHQQQQGQQDQDQADNNNMSKVQEALLLCVPTGFDLAATTLMNVGLLYVAASVFQILRGAEMVFAALFAVTFLHRPLNRWHYMGVALCMAGIGCVGASRMLAGDESGGVDAAAGWLLQQQQQQQLTAGPVGQDAAKTGNGGDGGGGGGGGAAPADPKMAVLGMGLILLSQAIQAAQVTVEDHLMSDMAMKPLLVVGWEGLIGSIVMLAGALPLLQHLPYRDGSGFAEDTIGSWCMIRNSGAIAGALGISTFAVLLYNIFGMFVTENVGAAARVVLENARTLLVWLTALTLYYTHVGGGKVGEPWDSWSWLQAVGFGIFAAGAFLYNKGHKQQEDEDVAAGKTPQYSKWAVLKSTLGIYTGHHMATRRFRLAGNVVLAGVRLANGLGRVSEESEE